MQTEVEIVASVAGGIVGGVAIGYIGRMTEERAVLRVGCDERVVGCSSDGTRLLGAAPGRLCRDVVRAVDRRGRAVCAAGCASALASDGRPRHGPAGTRVRGRLARLACEWVGGEVVVVVTLDADTNGAYEPLTARERAVLALVGEGLTDRLASVRLGISRSTVRTHVEHARDKLGVTTRAQAVLRARATGQLD